MRAPTYSLFILGLLAACGPDPLVPLLEAEPTSLDFTTATVDTQGAHHTVRLTNVGESRAQIQAVSFTGDEAGRLELDRVSIPASVAPTSSIDLTLRVVDFDDWNAGSTAMITVDYRGYDGIGDLAQITIPVTLELPTACDSDGDGVYADQCGGLDCDDSDPDVRPEVDEVCDGIDNDCDGTRDEPDAIDAVLWFADDDRDGFGDDSRTTPGCIAPANHSAAGGDCDDTEARANPAALEVCDDIDNDCNGEVDGFDAVNAIAVYADNDQDGWGNDDTWTWECDIPFQWTADGGDCDDENATAFPGAAELCDGLDDDCDGLVDEDAIDQGYWFGDDDGDGYGNVDNRVRGCDAPAGFGTDIGDCDDADPAINPDATETCNSIDDDCDGIIDEDGAGTRSSFYEDADGDSFGNASTLQLSCGQPDGYVTNRTDCDDTEAARFPGNAEICDDIDNDCDDRVDEDLICFEVCDDGLDNDGDGRADCLDDDCFGDDACGEICDDGADNDLDGRIDCADDDCQDSEFCAEVCDNGADDDFDGLIDCEDGDCFGTDACTEVECFDGVDNDGDGFVDCDDSDCFGPACAVDNSVRVVSARMRVVDQRTYNIDECFPPYVPIDVTRFQDDRQRKLYAYDVQGVAQAVSAAGGIQSCGWTVDKATAIASYRNGASFIGNEDPEVRVNAVVRQGFYAEPGCGLYNAGQLPRNVLPCPAGDPNCGALFGGDIAGVIAYPNTNGWNDFPTGMTLGALWYVGAGFEAGSAYSATTTPFVTSVYGFDIDCTAIRSTYTRTWSIPNASPGESYSFAP